MANFYKFHVTGDYKGGLQVGGTRYVAGDTFVVTQDQFKQFIRWSDVKKGYLLFMGEVNGDDTSLSDLVVDVLEEKGGTLVKNYMPCSGILSLTGGSVAAGGALGVQGADLSGIKLGRKVGVNAIQYRVSTSSAAADEPRLLVTSGKVKQVTPTALIAYDSSATTYYAMTNGSIAVNSPMAAWGANDLMIVGYSEKFRSINVTVATPASASTINKVYYWNGTAWEAFDNFTDYTMEPTAANSFDRASAVDANVRVVWWDTPANWKPGGPAGSGVPQNAYVVALRVSGVLTGLAGGRIYPVLDTPIADINAGEQIETFDAQLTQVGAVYTDYTGVGAVTLDLSTTEYLYLGSAKPFNGAYFNINTANAKGGSTISLKYWNGTGWSGAATTAVGAWGGTVADGTFSVADTFAQDGIVNWTTHRSDWNAVPYTSLTSAEATAIAALGTVTTDPLYWVRIATSAAIDNTTTTTAIYVIPSAVAWVDATVYNNSTDQDGEFHVHVIDENSTAALEVRAVVMDV